MRSASISLANLPISSAGCPLTSLGHGIEAQLFQSGNAFIEYLREIIFYPNRCSSEGYLGQQKSTVIGENR